MAGDDKTLRETVSEAVKAVTQKTETQEGISKSQSGETLSGGTPEYVAGVDISDIPEQDRPRIKAKLEAKLALLDKGYQPKFQKVAALEKYLADLSGENVTLDEARNVVWEYAEKKRNPTKAETKEAVRTLDKLIQESPYEQKEALQNMRKIILEETNVDKLVKKVEQLERVVNYFQGKDMQLGEGQLNQDLNTLREKFGKDFIDRHEEVIRTEWKKFPQSKAKDILKYVAPDEEYEQALLSKGNRNAEKLNAVTNNNSGVTSSTATLDVRKTSFNDILRSVIKK